MRTMAARWARHAALAVVACGCGSGGRERTQGPDVPAEAGETGSAAEGDAWPGPGVGAEAGPVALALPDGLQAAPSRTSEPVRELPGSAESCPPGMVLIAGELCPYMGHGCAEFIDEKADRCMRYVPPPLCEGALERRRFCIDRWEYPNLRGVRPAVMVSWVEALRACEQEGKRLCLSTEWTMACEGTERLPYPYGYARDRRVCNIDRPRPSPEPDPQAFSVPRRVGAEVARLDLRVPSDVLQGCVSPFGVHDMTGNVDEWVINEQHFDKVVREGEKPPYVSGLKGGYWGPIRARCRPMTTSHNEWFRYYQVGFRCCSDAQEGADGVAARYVRRLGVYRRQAEAPPSPAP
jgi:hypothetical protein